MSETGKHMLQIAAVCSFVAPVILLASDVLHIIGAIDFAWTIGLYWAMVLFVPAVIGLTYVVDSAGSRLAVIAGALALIGVIAGAGTQALFRVHAVLTEQGDLATVEKLRNSFKLVAATQMIGLPWPLGLILLSIAILVVDRSRWVLSIFLAAAGILFPIGRIAFVDAAILGSGVFLIASFWLAGKWMLARASLYE